MPKPVCVKCQRFYRPKRNGIAIVEGRPTFPGAEPGTSAPEKWVSYKLWQADLWECRGCGHELVSGFGRQPIREAHHADFEPLCDQMTDVLIPQINDC